MNAPAPPRTRSLAGRAQTDLAEGSKAGQEESRPLHGSIYSCRRQPLTAAAGHGRTASSRASEAMSAGRARLSEIGRRHGSYQSSRIVLQIRGGCYVWRRKKLVIRRESDSNAARRSTAAAIAARSAALPEGLLSCDFGVVAPRAPHGLTSPPCGPSSPTAFRLPVVPGSLAVLALPLAVHWTPSALPLLSARCAAITVLGRLLGGGANAAGLRRHADVDGAQSARVCVETGGAGRGAGGVADRGAATADVGVIERRRHRRAGANGVPPQVIVPVTVRRR